MERMRGNVRAHTVVVVHSNHLRALAKPELTAAMIAFYKKEDAAVALRHQVRRCRFEDGERARAA